MMNRKIKQKWLNALRSGNFQQGTGKLRDSNGNYCCLGVLCEITGNGQNRDMSKSFPADKDPDGTDINSVKPFMGLSVKMQEKLAEMNDYGDTFEEIASYISRNVKAEG